MIYYLIILVNILVIGIVLWFVGGLLGLGVTLGYTLIILCMPLMPFTDAVISFFFDLKNEVTDMTHLEKSVYISFVVYKVIMKTFAVTLATVIFMCVLFINIISVVGSDRGNSIIDSFDGLGHVYSVLIKKADQIVDVIIGTIVEICNYTRRKRLGMNVKYSSKDIGIKWINRKMGNKKPEETRGYQDDELYEMALDDEDGND